MSAQLNCCLMTTRSLCLSVCHESDRIVHLMSRYTHGDAAIPGAVHHMTLRRRGSLAAVHAAAATSPQRTTTSESTQVLAFCGPEASRYHHCAHLNEGLWRTSTPSLCFAAACCLLAEASHSLAPAWCHHAGALVQRRGGVLSSRPGGLPPRRGGRLFAPARSLPPRQSGSAGALPMG